MASAGEMLGHVRVDIAAAEHKGAMQTHPILANISTTMTGIASCNLLSVSAVREERKKRNSKTVRHGISVENSHELTFKIQIS